MTKKLLFLGLFSILGYTLLQIPFSHLAGSNISFTLFDFFAPIAGVFLGPVLAIFSILGVELFNVFINHQALTTVSIIRLFPLIFASLYFAASSKNQKWVLAIPILCILAFILNPVGRTVWYYSLFWTIPLIAYKRRDVLFFKSLGATFTAHAIGGAAWIWALNLPSSAWKALIPLVISERLLFAVGISGSYILVKYILEFLQSKNVLPKYHFS